LFDAGGAMEEIPVAESDERQQNYRTKRNAASVFSDFADNVFRA
jgi:hypothetical protein